MTETSCVNADEPISTTKRKPIKTRYDTAKNVLLRLTAKERLGVNRGRWGVCGLARKVGCSTSAASKNAGKERDDAENKNALAYSAGHRV